MHSELKYWYLHDHKLFKNLSFNEVDSLCILSKFKKSDKNEIVDLPFSEKERIYYLKKGTIKLIQLSSEGEEILIDILQSGDLFGELNFDNPSNTNEFIKVVSEEAVMCTFYREKLENLIQHKPDFALSYIKFLGFNFKRVQNSYKNIFFKDTKTRLLLLLQMIAEKEGAESGAFVFPNYLTQKDFAQLICATRQTVITLIKELEKDGILKYSQKEIVLQNVEELKKMIESVK